jgi:hypothetical protein
MDFFVHTAEGYWQLLIEPNVFIWLACIVVTYWGMGGLEEPQSLLGELFWRFPLLLRIPYTLFLIALSSVMPLFYLVLLVLYWVIYPAYDVIRGDAVK